MMANWLVKTACKDARMSNRWQLTSGLISRVILLAAAAVGPPAAYAQAQMTQASPTDKSTRVEADELQETWNDRVSQGAPVETQREFDGWSLGTAMPLPRSEHSVAEFAGKVWVLGGYPPGRLPSDLVQVYDPAVSRW
jgi:hypothetical protein